MYVYMYECMYVCMYVCMYMYTVYICKYVYYSHVYMFKCIITETEKIFYNVIITTSSHTSMSIHIINT